MLRKCAYNVLYLLLFSSGGQDRGIAEHTIVQSALGLLSLLPVTILDQSDPVGEVQVEVVQWTVLHAQSAESGAVNLSS